MPASDSHFKMAGWWRQEAKERYGIDYSIAVLEYSMLNSSLKKLFINVINLHFWQAWRTLPLGLLSWFKYQLVWRISSKKDMTLQTLSLPVIPQEGT